MSVVRAALAEYESDPEYDKIYCVFDRDTHATYQAALQHIQQHKLFKAKKLFGITSEPCFEIWLLLHFMYSAAPFKAAGKKSSCDRLLDEIRKIPGLKNYEKGFQDIYTLVGSQTSTAIKNGTRLSKENAASESTNPSTKMHLLATYLHNLAKKKIGSGK